MNLAAGQGHPSAAMDLSFANLALGVEHLALGRRARESGAGVPREIDDEIARLKLESLGVAIDTLTPGPGGLPERLDRPGPDRLSAAAGPEPTSAGGTTPRTPVLRASAAGSVRR